MRRIVTIGREFGSGGREFGYRLAENLGAAYYGQEIITEQATGVTLPNSLVSAFYYEAVQWACAEGIIPATFNGEVDCTCATALELLWRAAGHPVPVSPANFNDMEPDAPFFDAITWAVEQKITSDTGGGNFSPNAICTRGQIVTFLHWAMEK